MYNRRISASWGTLEINSDWIKDFFESDEIRKEVELVANYIFNKQPIAPRHKVNMSIDTRIRRGRYTTQIVWKQENVYFRELHFKYLSKMVRKKYEGE